MIERQQELDVRRYLSAIWAWKWLIVGIAAFGLVAGKAYVEISSASGTGSAATYEGKATIRIDRALTASNPALSGGGSVTVVRAATAGLEAHLSLVLSSAVLERAVIKLDGLQPGSVVPSGRVEQLRAASAVALVERTDFLDITVTGPSEVIARLRAEAIANSYGEFLLDTYISSATEELNAIRSQITASTNPAVTDETKSQLSAVAAEISGLLGTLRNSHLELSSLEASLASANDLGQARVAASVHADAALRKVAEMATQVAALEDKLQEQTSSVLPEADVPAALSSLSGVASSLARDVEALGALIEQAALAEIVESAVDELTASVLPLRNAVDDLERIAAEIRLFAANEAVAESSQSIATALAELSLAESEVQPSLIPVEPTQARLVQLQTQIGASRISVVRLSTITAALFSDPVKPNVLNAAANDASAVAINVRAVLSGVADVRRTAIASATVLEKLASAEARLKHAADEMEVVAEAMSGAATGGSAADVADLAAALSTVADANESISTTVLKQLAAGSADSDPARLTANQATAAVVTLDTAIASLAEVRSDPANGHVYADMVVVESLIRSATSSTRNVQADIARAIDANPAVSLMAARDTLRDMATDIQKVALSIESMAISSSSTGGQLREEANISVSELVSKTEGVTSSLRSDVTTASSLQIRDMRTKAEAEIAAMAKTLRSVRLGLDPASLADVQRLLSSMPDIADISVAADLELQIAAEALTTAGSGQPQSSVDTSKIIEESLAGARASLESALQLASVLADTTDDPGLKADLATVTAPGAGAIAGIDGVSSILGNASTGVQATTVGRLEAASTGLGNTIANLEAAATSVDIDGIAALEASVRVGDAKVRLTLAASDLDRASTELQGVDRTVLPNGGSQAALISGRLTAARTSVNAVNARMPSLQVGQDATTGELAVTRSALETLIASDPQSGIQTVDVTTVLRAQAISPRTSRRGDLSVLVGGILGLVVGSAGAVVGELVSRRVRGPQDLQRVAGAAAVTVIPGEKAGEINYARVGQHPDSPFDEMFHTLAANVDMQAARKSRSALRESQAAGQSVSPLTDLAAAPDAHARNASPRRTVLVTSPNSDKSATFISENLALAVATRGGKVLLVHADMRAQRNTDGQESQALTGLADALDGRISDVWSEVITEDIKNLSVMHSGLARISPSALVSRPVFEEVLAQAQQKFEYVIINGPPSIGSSTAFLIAQKTSHVVIVALNGRTTRSNVETSASNIDPVPQPTGAGPLVVLMSPESLPGRKKLWKRLMPFRTGRIRSPEPFMPVPVVTNPAREKARKYKTG